MDNGRFYSQIKSWRVSLARRVFVTMAKSTVPTFLCFPVHHSNVIKAMSECEIGCD
jgi:hypothetical protein